MKFSFFKKFIYFVIILGLFPGIVFAANSIPFPNFIPKEVGGNFWDYLDLLILNLLSFIWKLFAAYAVGMFIYAGFLFLNARGDAKVAKEARHAVAWGSVGVGIGLLAFTIPYIVSGVLGF